MVGEEKRGEAVALAVLVEEPLPDGWRIGDIEPAFIGIAETDAVRRTPDPVDGRYTLAILTDAGWGKVVATAPGHVEEVRRLVFDPLTKAQQRQLRDIGRRVMRAIDPETQCLKDGP